MTERSLTIRAGARLHFGLLDTVPPFGGLGVMVRQPETRLTIESCSAFECDAGLLARVHPVLERLMRVSGQSERPAVRVRLMHQPPPHSGFGSGTQLSLAIAEGLGRFMGAIEGLSNERLACQIADRGKRSAVGVHGYFHGGLIFETGSEASQLNAIAERVVLDPDWRVVLLRSKDSAPAVCGETEAEQFNQLGNATNVSKQFLYQIAADEVLPAARQRNFESFTDAVGRFNYTSGMLFASLQGGPYNGNAVTDLIERLTAAGVSGVGQSSWGPGVFAWCQNESDAQSLANEFSCDRVDAIVTEPISHGRVVESLQGKGP